MKKKHLQEHDYKNVTTFPGLNGLRFLAAFLVVMHHSEVIKQKNGIANLEWVSLFRNGGNAVTFFFVLSGFLITYLLLKEQGKTNTIRVKTFYLKRVLRIWPLYFLLVFIGTIVLPYAFEVLGIDYKMPYTLGQTWYYFLFFLPCLVTYFYGHHLLEPLWSIGVEEVFYLIWAPLFKVFKTRILVLLVSIILIKLALNFWSIFVSENELINFLINTFKFEAMAIGGLGAYFLYTSTVKWDKLFLFSVPVQMLAFVTLILFLALNTNIDFYPWNLLFKSQVFSLVLIEFLFLYLILCVSVINRSLLKLENQVLSFLGQISYGIYMYHMLVIFATVLFLKKYLLQMSPLMCHLVFYSVVTAGTLIVAIGSKYLFEDYFLKLKERL